MLEPPPSAKPFTTDVDRKLEEGQKVINRLSITKALTTSGRFPTLYPCPGSCEDKVFLCTVLESGDLTWLPSL